MKPLRYVAVCSINTPKIYHKNDPSPSCNFPKYHLSWEGVAEAPSGFFFHRWTHIWIHSWMPSWYLANARYLRRHLGEHCTGLRLVERQYPSKMSQWLSYARFWMPVLKFLNKNSHGIRPLAGYCWGVSGIGFLDPRNGNRNGPAYTRSFTKSFLTKCYCRWSPC